MKKLSILLVSSNKIRLDHLTRILGKTASTCGFTTTTDKQALAVVQEQHWDIIISDLDMPHITGLQLIDALSPPGIRTHLLLIGKQMQSIVDAIQAYARSKGVTLTVLRSPTLIVTDIERCMSAYTSPKNLGFLGEAFAYSNDSSEPPHCLDRIVAYYQPQHWVDSGKLYGAEALARWDRQELGILGALQLLPIFNSVKLRETLWDRMLDHSITMLKHSSCPQLCIGTNVSADVASSVSWAENISRKFAQNNISSERLTVEITEDVGDNLDAGMLGAISQLRLRGFTCAIDDFGIGFSSLQRLAMAPLNALKIDQYFVRQAQASLIGQKILANTITMARDLGLSVTAEGIETKEDFERIKKLGVDLAQGYYFAKPMPAAEFIEYVQKN